MVFDRVNERQSIRLRIVTTFCHDFFSILNKLNRLVGLFAAVHVLFDYLIGLVCNLLPMFRVWY